MSRVLALAFVWGWSFLFIKVAVEGMPPTAVAAGRIALGALVLVAVLAARGLRLPQGRAIWRHLAVAALFGNVAPFTLLAWGEERISSALTSVLNASTPLFTAAFAAAVLHERLRPPQVAGLLLGLGGVAVAAGVGADDLATSSLLGGLASVAAGACYGASFVYVRRHLMGLPPVVAAAGQLVAGTVLLGPLAVAASLASGVDAAPHRLGALVVLGTVGTGLAYVLYYRAVADLGPTRTSLVTYLVPVVAVTVGVVVLGEPFRGRTVAGGAVIVAGILLVHWGPALAARLRGGGRGRARRLARGAVVGPAPRAVALLAGTAAGAAALVACGTGAADDAACGPVQRERVDPASFTHLLPGAPAPDYLSDPPTSGPHLVGPLPQGPVDEPVPAPVQVAVLEEGGVVVQYGDLPAEDVAALAGLAGDGVVVAPGDDLPAPVVATAWARKQACDEVDLAALEAFVEGHLGEGPASHG